MPQKKTGLSRLKDYKRPLRPKERLTNKIDTVRLIHLIEDFFSSFSEEQMERSHRVNTVDKEKRAKERQKRVRDSERRKAKELEEKKVKSNRFLSGGDDTL